MFDKEKYLREKSLVLENDPSNMNWVEGDKPLGTVSLPQHSQEFPTGSLRVETESEFLPDGAIRETYRFSNPTRKTIFIKNGDLGIRVPFNDDILSAGTCMRTRCYAHVFCGGDVAWIMGLRMNGQPGNVGLVLTRGRLLKYSIERDFSKLSGDRGDMILHPAPFRLGAGESYEIQWVFFRFEDQHDFLAAAKKYAPGFVEVRANHYVLFRGETLSIKIIPNFSCQKVFIREGVSVEELTSADGVFVFSKAVDAPREYVYEVNVDGVCTFITIKVQPSLEELAAARCRFIVEKQQFCKENDPLDGAFLIYDNEEKAPFYEEYYDHNAARERIGMGALLARWLQKHRDARIETGFRRYIAFLKREIVDVETGWVYNDVEHSNRWIRLFNFTWTAQAFIEIYKYTGDREDLLTAARIMRTFFGKSDVMKQKIAERRQASEDISDLDFNTCCAHVMPVRELLSELNRVNEDALAAELKECYLQYADLQLALGDEAQEGTETAYGPHQEAVFSRLMVEDFIITGDEKYEKGARRHYRRNLASYSLITPDWHNNHVMETYWDDYWFGKRQLFGDVTPHYWTVLAGDANMSYYDLTGDEIYLNRAMEAFRATCGLVFPDGSASCAYVKPFSVNGIRAEFFDPWANDQDWGLFFMLRYGELLAGRS